MGIKHKTPKASGQEGFATEWNDEHKIDSDVNFAGHSGVNLGEPVAPSDIATKNYVDTKGVSVGGKAVWSGGPGTDTIGRLDNGRFLSINNIMHLTGIESAVEIGVPALGTVRNLTVHGVSNGLDQAGVFTVRKNRVNTALTVSVTARTAGTFADNSNSFTVVQGDRISVVFNSVASSGLLLGVTISVVIEFD